MEDLGSSSLSLRRHLGDNGVSSSANSIFYFSVVIFFIVFLCIACRLCKRFAIQDGELGTNYFGAAGGIQDAVAVNRRDVFYGEDTEMWCCEICEHSNVKKVSSCILCGAEREFKFRDSCFSLAVTPVEGSSSSTSTANYTSFAESRKRRFLKKFGAMLTKRQRLARHRRDWVRKVNNEGRFYWEKQRTTLTPRRSVDMESYTSTKELERGRGRSSVFFVTELAISPSRLSGRLTLTEVSRATPAINLKGKEITKQDMETLEIVSSLPFADKYAWFLKQCSLLLKSGEDGHLKMRIHRENILRESIEQLLGIQQQHIHLPLRLEFIGESGVDAGGIGREWYTLLTEQIFNDENGLFRACKLENPSYTINPDSKSYTPDHLHYFRGIGRLLGRGLLEGHLSKAHISLSLLKHFLGAPMSFRDLEFLDEDLYRSLLWMKKNSMVESLSLDFTVMEERGGRFEQVDLIPGGSQVEVTDANKHEYINARFRYAMLDSIQEQLKYLVMGLFEVIPQELILIFDYQELELVLSGVPDIDVDDWEQNYECTDNLRGTDLLGWFWETIRKFSSAERAKFLQFCTGSSRVPPQGFRALTSYDGRVCIFQLRGIPLESNAYPRAHTCFNRIDLPLYNTKEELVEALNLVINMEFTGFSED